jgi:3-hydroxyisobutyrate/3-hydroxypropionate dehydrogenase
MVITMLPISPVVTSVYEDSSTGILAGITALAKSNSSTPIKKVIMECGTIETATILAVQKATQKVDSEISSSGSGSGVTFIDAPVSGGPMGAQDGSLTFMVGAAKKEDYETVKKILAHMGNKDGIFHCGDVGAGTAFKVINNYLSAVTSLAASEALNIGAKLNLDLKLLTDVINASGGQCWVTSKSNPVPGIHANAPASRGYEGGFRIELCKKVLGMGLELGDMCGARMDTGRTTLKAFEEAAADDRYKGKDARVVWKWLNDQ